MKYSIENDTDTFSSSPKIQFSIETKFSFSSSRFSIKQSWAHSMKLRRTKSSELSTRVNFISSLRNYLWHFQSFIQFLVKNLSRFENNVNGEATRHILLRSKIRESMWLSVSRFWSIFFYFCDFNFLFSTWQCLEHS